MNCTIFESGKCGLYCNEFTAYLVHQVCQIWGNLPVAHSTAQSTSDEFDNEDEDEDESTFSGSGSSACYDDCNMSCDTWLSGACGNSCDSYTSWLISRYTNFDVI